MELKLSKKFIEEEWDSGTSVQLGIYPSKATPEKGDFVWMSSISQDEEIENNEIDELDELSDYPQGKTFSVFKGYERTVTILDGNVILAHGEDRAERLGKYSQTKFDGGIRTDSFGTVKVHILTAKKNATTRVEALSLDLKTTKTFSCLQDKNKASILIYCEEGFAIFSFQDKRIRVREKENFVLNMIKEEREEIKINILGSGLLVISEVYFNEEEKTKVLEFENNKNTTTDPNTILEKVKVVDELTEQNKYEDLHGINYNDLSPIKDGKFHEYIFVIKLANTFRRGQGVLRKKSDDIFYSKELKDKVEKIRSAFIPSIIGVISFISFVLVANLLDKAALYIILMMLWPIFVFGIINPMIYYIAIPKPIQRHVRYKEALSEGEKNNFVSICSEENKTDRILKKYKDNSNT